MTGLSHNLQGAIYGLIAFGVWATHDVFIKMLGAHYSSVQVLFITFVFYMPLVIGMIVMDRTKGSLWPVYPGWMVTRSIATIVQGLGTFIAFAHLPLAHCYAILFAMPVFITLLAMPMLRESVGIHRWLAIIAGLIGILVVLRPGYAELSIGHGAALISALAGSLNSVITRKVGHAERMVVQVLYPSLAVLIATGMMVPFFFTPPSLGHIGLNGLIGVMSFVALLAILMAYRLGEAAVVAPMQYSQMLWALLYGYVIFSETLDLVTGLGASIVMASGLYILWRERQAGKAALAEA
ncbi:MAG: DMT family transporter [Pseudomonadota bacterium]